MEEIITKQDIQKLKAIKGDTRGVAFKADGEFILIREKEEGLKRLEERMKELGHPIKYEEIKSMDFYPIWLRGLELLVIKELFDFQRKDFQELGAFQTKTSLIVRAFMKFFISPEVLSGQVSKIWRRYYSVGDLSVSEMNTKNKFAILHLKNFALHPLHCQLLEGYFANAEKMVVGSPVTCEETKCIFKGDEYHEFYLRW